MAEISYSIYVAKDMADGTVYAVLGVHNYSTGVGDLVQFKADDGAHLAQIFVIDDYAREEAREFAAKMNHTGTLYKADGVFECRDMKWPEPKEETDG